jgi:hypothetical protein
LPYVAMTWEPRNQWPHRIRRIHSAWSPKGAPRARRGGRKMSPMSPLFDSLACGVAMYESYNTNLLIYDIFTWMYKYAYDFLSIYLSIYIWYINVCMCIYLYLHIYNMYIQYVLYISWLSSQTIMMTVMRPVHHLGVDMTFFAAWKAVQDLSENAKNAAWLAPHDITW